MMAMYNDSTQNSFSQGGASCGSSPALCHTGERVGNVGRINIAFIRAELRLIGKQRQPCSITIEHMFTITEQEKKYSIQNRGAREPRLRIMTANYANHGKRTTCFSLMYPIHLFEFAGNFELRTLFSSTAGPQQLQNWACFCFQAKHGGVSYYTVLQQLANVMGRSMMIMYVAGTGGASSSS